MKKSYYLVAIAVLALALVFTLGRASSTNVTVKSCGTVESGGWQFKNC